MEHKTTENIKRAADGVKNMALRAVGESLKPRWLWFGVTDRCNSRCKFCDIWRKEPARYFDNKSGNPSP